MAQLLMESMAMVVMELATMTQTLTRYLRYVVLKKKKKVYAARQILLAPWQSGQGVVGCPASSGPSASTQTLNWPPVLVGWHKLLLVFGRPVFFPRGNMSGLLRALFSGVRTL